ncbi:MAG: magnetochrome domain-containing protein [Deltaproteobacteria bacterium]|nr:magnetochrome domain-containing protein [Deltaproteobacteria bacterium]
MSQARISLTPWGRRVLPFIGLGLIVALICAGMALTPAKERPSPEPAQNLSAELLPIPPQTAPAVQVLPPAQPTPVMPVGGLRNGPSCTQGKALPVAAYTPSFGLPEAATTAGPRFATQPVALQQVAPPATVEAVAPTLRRAPPSAQVAQAPAASTVLPILPFVEAHWQGLEALENTPVLAKSLGIPPDAKGVIIDEATMPADAAGFLAGDLVMSVAQVPTPDLMSFIEATSRVRDRRRAEVELLRKGRQMRLVIVAMLDRLGTANGETAQTIQAGARPPHDYLGPCTNCHRIGTKAQLGVDQGDQLVKNAPPIRSGQPQPHKDRGTCTSCHQITAASLPTAAPIRAGQPAPHENRGACSGCHKVQLSTGAGAAP